MISDDVHRVVVIHRSVFFQSESQAWCLWRQEQSDPEDHAAQPRGCRISGQPDDEQTDYQCSKMIMTQPYIFKTCEYRINIIDSQGCQRLPANDVTVTEFTEREIHYE